MAELLFVDLFIDDAKKMLEISFENDETAIYIDDNCVSGSEIESIILNNGSHGYFQLKYDVQVTSDTLDEETLKEFFDNFLFALK